MLGSGNNLQNGTGWSQLLNTSTFSDPSGLILLECRDGTPGVSCSGYTPNGGCPGGCGTKANEAYGKGVKDAVSQAGNAVQEELGLSDEEVRALSGLMYDDRSGWEVALEALTELLGELSGINSIRDCFNGEGFC